MLRTVASVLVTTLLANPLAASAASFVVGEIRIEGLQRIAEGTVFNYLPVNIGDELDSRRIGEAVRALYGTGFFRDVEMRRTGGALIVAVVERPTIESFELKGNKDIKTEDLERSLRNVGLAAGKTFDQSVLDEVRQYLTEQYFSRGKYAVKVDARADDVPGNKVKVAIAISEGTRARIHQINITGNHAFTDQELTQPFELSTPNWLSWYRQDDRYAREALSGDIEKLRSYYMDRGFADFAVTSTQVAIGPDKDEIFITLNVHEGDVHRVSQVRLSGEMVVPESELRRLVMVQPGELYSLRQVTQTTEAISLRLGLDGYAFAKVDAVPQIDPDTKQLSLALVVDTTALPPQRNFFVGGPGTVRGFEESHLGPRDSLGNPYGGDFAVTGQLEAILPMPDKFKNSARVTLFYDFGQVAYLGDTQFTDKGGFPVEYDFDWNHFRSSVGVGVEWLAPLGLFRFSYAVLLTYRRSTELNYGDELKGFQFSIGSAF